MKGQLRVSPRLAERKNMNQSVSDSGWISCNEKLPEEYDSIFAKLKGTDKWNDMFMFEKSSDYANVTVELTDCTRVTRTMRTIDGKWVYKSNVIKSIIAWQPLPEPYREDG